MLRKFSHHNVVENFLLLHLLELGNNELGGVQTNPLLEQKKPPEKDSGGPGTKVIKTYHP